jgi:hypothetical protein
MSDTPKKAGNPKGTSQVRNEGVKKIQALAMMRELALGKSVPEVAKQFNTSNTIVRARLSYAQRAGLFVHHEDVILTQMVPKAQAVLLAALSDNHLDPALRIKVALEVDKGVGLLRKPGTAAPAALQGVGKKAQVTLQDYINQLRDSTGKLPEGVAIDTEYSFVGEPEPLALSAGGNEPAAEERADSERTDESHGDTTAPVSAGVGPVDEEAGVSFSTFGSFLSEVLGQGPSEPRGEDSGISDSASSDAAGELDGSRSDSGEAAEEPVQELP